MLRAWIPKDRHSFEIQVRRASKIETWVVIEGEGQPYVLTC